MTELKRFPLHAASPKFKQFFIYFCAADAAAHLPDLSPRAELCAETVCVFVRARVRVCALPRQHKQQRPSARRLCNYRGFLIPSAAHGPCFSAHT